MQLRPPVILVLLTAVVLLTSVGITSFSLFLPPIEADFNWSRATVTLPYTVAMIAWGLSAPLAGKLADDYGARRVILGGIVLMAAGFLGMGVAQNLWQLSLFFGLMVGFAMGACTLSTVSLLVSQHFDSRSRGLAVSAVQTASPLNPIVFAPLLFVLVQAFGWRVAALTTSGLLLAIAFPLAWLGARDPNRSHGGSRDRVSWRGCIPYLLNRPMIVLFLARFSCGFAFFQIAHLVALTLSKGFGVAAGATAVTVFGASAVASALLFGWLSDRYGRARILGLSYFVRGLGTLAFAFSIPSELWFYLLVAVAIGPTFGTVAVNNVMFYEAVGPKLAGVVLGLSFVVHQAGSASGPLLGGIIYDLTQSYDGFTLAMGLILLAAGAVTYNLKDTELPRQAALRNSWGS